MKTVSIPNSLQKLTDGESILTVNGNTIMEVINELETRYRGIHTRLIGDDGKVRRFINVYVNEEDIRFLNEEQTTLKDGDEIIIIPAVAGG